MVNTLQEICLSVYMMWCSSRIFDLNIEDECGIYFEHNFVLLILKDITLSTLIYTHNVTYQTMDMSVSASTRKTYFLSEFMCVPNNLGINLILYKKLLFPPISFYIYSSYICQYLNLLQNPSLLLQSILYLTKFSTNPLAYHRKFNKTV